MITLIAALFVGTSLALSHSDFYTHVEKLDASMPHPITLFVKLHPSVGASCPKHLYEVSDPRSPKYGQHWSFEDMKQFANTEAFAATKTWLAEAGFAAEQLEFAPNMEFISVKSTVGDLERVFGVEMHKYVHNDNSQVIVHAAKDGYVMPQELAQHVDTINGLKGLPYYRAGQKPLIMSSEENQKRQGGYSVPQLLWAYYGVHNRTVATTKASNQIFASLGQSFSPADLLTWQNNKMLPRSVIKKVTGPNTPSACSQNPNNCIEANLDVQQITSTAQMTDSEFWSIPASIQDIFLYWAQGMVKDPNAPLVNSISYGSLGPEDPKNDMKRFAHEVCKLGLRGITVISASGDDGVANFDARNNPLKCGFTPSYPATVPYVTAVGATQGPEMQQAEIMCSASTGGGITSGGGFSDFFTMPAYQVDAVHNYLNNPNANLPPKHLFNYKGRAYPDVAMMGHNYEIVVGGSTYAGSGTSASAPVFASMITLINGLRLNAGKGPVGFLNPTIYQMANSTTTYSGAFHDITSGRNNCCAGAQGQATCCNYGFTCTKNFDPATGVGSIRFPGFSKYFLSLP